MLPKQALTDIDIIDFGKQHFRHFRGVFMCDRLPKKPCLFLTEYLDNFSSPDLNNARASCEIAIEIDQESISIFPYQ